MRWYELDPTVYMAISMIEMSELNKQFEYANYILKQIDEKTNDYVLKNIIALSKSQIHPKNRWYDKHELISKAFDYLKEVPKEIQKIVSEEVLEYIRVAA